MIPGSGGHASGSRTSTPHGPDRSFTRISPACAFAPRTRRRQSRLLRAGAGNGQVVGWDQPRPGGLPGGQAPETRQAERPHPVGRYQLSRVAVHGSLMRRTKAHRDERPVAPARRAPACRPRWSLARRGASKPGSVSRRGRRSARLLRPARDAEVPRLSSAAWRRGRAIPGQACNEPRGERGREGRACKGAGRSGVRQVGGVPGTPSAWRGGLCA